MFLPALRLDWDIDKRQTSTLVKESQIAGENLIFLDVCCFCEGVALFS